MSTKLDRILATLNSAEVGPIDRISEKMGSVAAELRELEQSVLAERADEAIAALGRADLKEFRRLRAFIQSKVGHLR